MPTQLLFLQIVKWFNSENLQKYIMTKGAKQKMNVYNKQAKQFLINEIKEIKIRLASLQMNQRKRNYLIDSIVRKQKLIDYYNRHSN